MARAQDNTFSHKNRPISVERTAFDRLFCATTVVWRAKTTSRFLAYLLLVPAKYLLFAFRTKNCEPLSLTFFNCSISDFDVYKQQFATATSSASVCVRPGSDRKCLIAVSSFSRARASSSSNWCVLGLI